MSAVTQEYKRWCALHSSAELMVQKIADELPDANRGNADRMQDMARGLREAALLLDMAIAYCEPKPEDDAEARS